MSNGRLSGERWNRITDGIVQRYRKLVDMYKSELLSDGYPPFHVKLTPLEKYQKMAAARAAGDPLFWGDDAAQAEFERLAAQFGPPEALTPGPFGEVVR